MSKVEEHFEKIYKHLYDLKKETKALQEEGHIRNGEEFVRITDIEIAVEEAQKTYKRTEFEKEKKR